MKISNASMLRIPILLSSIGCLKSGILCAASSKQASARSSKASRTTIELNTPAEGPDTSKPSFFTNILRLSRDNGKIPKLGEVNLPASGWISMQDQDNITNLRINYSIAVAEKFDVLYRAFLVLTDDAV